METKFVITELLENTTKEQLLEQLLDDFYAVYSEKLKLQERVKELEDKAIEARMKENERNHNAEIEMSKSELVAKIKLLEQQLGSKASVEVN